MIEPDTTIAEPIRDALRRYWGFDELRPLQDRAIDAALHGRDSLVVMPTGGGKSLCYQVPPLLADRPAVVVSPLIALMKDQVDGLRLNGYPTGALHSGLATGEAVQIEEAFADGDLRLLFVSPERLLTARCLTLLAKANVGSFAIDEAHCISEWGHDFRPEYRRLAELRTIFPDAAFHAFTATATPKVRDGIVAQLELRDADVLVGTFDRPNLFYRIIARNKAADQVYGLVRQHPDEASIVYCITRKNTETLARGLKDRGINAEAYHAGLPKDERRRIQEDFAAERLNVVVATVAFGMGIDRSNVRCVVHASMPKSIEAYQQETGRAGRDGLKAECVMLFGGSDVIKWKDLIKRSAEEANDPEQVARAQERLCEQVNSYCMRAACRHRALSEYFGQDYEPDNCGACDVCLGEIKMVPDAHVVAQKILSCVARVEQRFGARHIIDILRGKSTERIASYRHDALTTFGLLRDTPAAGIASYIDQLIELEALERTEGEYPVIRFGPRGRDTLKGDPGIELRAPPVRSKAPRGAPIDDPTWTDADQSLFDALRAVRREIADQRAVPPYVVFSDATLRDMTKRRPVSFEQLLAVRGVGHAKRGQFGKRFINAILEHDGHPPIEEPHPGRIDDSVDAAS